MKTSFEKRQQLRDKYNKMLDEATGELVYWGNDPYLVAPRDYLEQFDSLPLKAPLTAVISTHKISYPEIFLAEVNARKLVIGKPI